MEEQTYEMKLNEAASLTVQRDEYPKATPTIEDQIRAKTQEISDLKNEREPRPATKIEYINLLEQLEAQKADLIAENNQIFADNLEAKKAVDDKYAADITMEKNKPEVQWVAIREVRNHLLDGSDWTQLLDVPMQKDQYDAWKKYRQMLRDIPQISTKPDDVRWPEIPA